MALNINFYLHSLLDKECQDKLLYSTLKKSINNIKEEDWKIIEQPFKEGISYLTSSDEVMAYAFIALEVKEEFLNKDKEYTSELVSALITEEVCVQNYIKYVKIFLTEPIYSLLIEFVSNSKIYSYYNIFSIILSKHNLDIESLIKALYKLNNKEYHLFKSDSLYNEIYLYMKNMNKKAIIYPYDSFITLAKLKYISYDIKSDILRIEEDSYCKRDFVDKVLEYLSNKSYLRRTK